MTGRDELVAMRKRGMQPAGGVLWHLTDRPMPESEANLPVWYLRADIDDRFDRLDLRCLVGLKVVVVGPYMADERIREACFAADAAKAAAVFGFATDTHKLRASSLVFVSGDIPWLQ